MTEPKIAPRMEDGVGYCDAGCLQCLTWDDHYFEVRCSIDKLWRKASHPKLSHLETSRICPVWAQRLAAWADEAREWAVSWAHHHQHLVPEKLLSRYPGGNDQSQDGNGGG